MNITMKIIEELTEARNDYGNRVDPSGSFLRGGFWKPSKPEAEALALYDWQPDVEDPYFYLNACRTFRHVRALAVVNPRHFMDCYKAAIKRPSRDYNHGLLSQVADFMASDTSLDMLYEVIRELRSLGLIDLDTEDLYEAKLDRYRLEREYDEDCRRSAAREYQFHVINDRDATANPYIRLGV